jgi:hypothetical protein
LGDGGRFNPVNDPGLNRAKGDSAGIRRVEERLTWETCFSTTIEGAKSLRLRLPVMVQGA